MITLYHCAGARSFRVLWALEECGLRYELKVLPFPPRVHAREYLQVNPLGTVPLLADGDLRMTESAAICQYLAAKYGGPGFAVGEDEAHYGLYLNWLHFGEATLTFPQTLVLRYGELEPLERRQPQVVEDYTRWFLARLRAVQSVLAVNEYICAGRFTAADISIGYALMLAQDLGLGERLPAEVLAYSRRLGARAAFRRAFAAQGPFTPISSKARG